MASGPPGQPHSLVGLVAVSNFDATLDEAHHVLVLQGGEMLRAGPGWVATGLRGIIQGSGYCLALPGPSFMRGPAWVGSEASPLYPWYLR